MEARLYSIPASHPAMTVRLMLERKGIPYKRIDLMPVISRGILKVMRFPENTVPALRIDGRKLSGSTEIARELDRLVPEPPLYPTDPALLAEVESAERFGRDDVQTAARRMLWNAVRRDRSALGSYAKGARLGVPIWLAVKTSAPIVAADIKMNKANDENVRADLAALPGMLTRIDDWIAAGVLGGEEPNAADLQLATSLRLMMSLDDLRPAIESRPAGEMALRFVPDYPGRVPPVLPEAWLAPLRDPAAVAS